ncbi:MAG: WG repeat-containing protein [Alistipes sp.]|nr:WG repeat-containing protein [Alistipes sp.]
MKHLKQIFQALLGVVALIFTAIIAFGRLAWRTIRNWWKNRSKWVRRSIAAILIIVPVGFVALMAFILYEDNFGRDYWDRRLSDNITLHSYSDNTWRVYDCTTKEYTTDKINWISSVPENDSLAVYALPNKRGYINVNTGRIVIDAEANDYRKAWVFSEGLAAVMKDGKIGFINAENEVVIPFKFSYNHADYIFNNGYCVMPSEDGFEGVIDKTGEWVIEPIYKSVSDVHSVSGYRIIVDKHGQYGVLDASSQLVCPADYDYISFVDDGIMIVDDGVKQMLDFACEVVKPFVVDSLDILCYPSYCDENGYDVYAYSRFATYMIYIDYIDYYGVIDRFTGEMIIPAIYSDVRMISDELFEVQKYNETERVLINTNGNIVNSNL